MKHQLKSAIYMANIHYGRDEIFDVYLKDVKCVSYNANMYLRSDI